MKNIVSETKHVGIIAFLMIAMFATHWFTTKPVETAKATIELKIPEEKRMIFTEDEIQCVRNTVFGESRGQSFETQVAVAATIVNRSLAGNWPTDLCKIVKQPGQFAGYKETVVLVGQSSVDEWDDALRSTAFTLRLYNNLPIEYRIPLYFNTAGQTPEWRKIHKYIGRIGGLEFYG